MDKPNRTTRLQPRPSSSDVLARLDEIDAKIDELREIFSGLLEEVAS